MSTPTCWNCHVEQTPEAEYGALLRHRQAVEERARISQDRRAQENRYLAALLDVPCETCDATPGVLCRSATGRTVYEDADDQHAPRRRLAREVSS